MRDKGFSLTDLERIASPGQQRRQQQQRRNGSPKSQQACPCMSDPPSHRLTKNCQKDLIDSTDFQQKKNPNNLCDKKQRKKENAEANSISISKSFDLIMCSPVKIAEMNLKIFH